MRAFSFLFLFVFWFQMPVSGSGFQLYLLGSRSLGMGQVGTGSALDASSVFFNPGAMGFQNGQIQFGGGFSAPLTAYLEPNPGIALAFSEPVYLSPLYLYSIFRVKKGSPLSFGISVNSPYNHAIWWPKEWVGRFVSLESSRNSLFIQPTVSYRFGTNFGIGVGLVIARSSLFLKRAITAVGAPATGVDPTVSLSSSGNALGYNLGLYYRPDPDLSIGINYRSGINFGMVPGIASFDVPASVSSEYPDKPFTTPMQLPAVLSAGFGYRPQEGVLFCFEINYTRWSIFDSVKFMFDPETMQHEDFGSVPNYRNTYSYRLGAEIDLSPKIDLLLGTYYDLSPVMDGFVSPELPDANRLGTTAGICMQLSEQLSFEAALLFETTGERTAVFVEKGFAGTYQTNTGAVSLGIKYAFSER